MELKISRTTLTAGTPGTVTFTDSATNYLVKNFGSADLYVSFETPIDTSKAVRIKQNYGQIVTPNVFPGRVGTQVKTLYLSGAGEVEIQQYD